MKLKESAKKRSWWIYILAFCIPVGCLVVHMVTGDCYPFGKNSILIGDAGDQYLSFFTELYNRIKNGQSLLFSWNGGMGYDFYSNLMYYLMSPFNLLALCFGGYSMECGMIVTMAVEIGGCAVTALYYFRHSYLNSMKHGRLNDGVTLLFSVSYAMCNYILAYQYNMMWLTGLMLVPLVMLGIEKIVRKQDYRLYVVTLFLTLVTNFYFAWFVCILSFLWFLDQNRGGLKEWCFRFVKWILASVCAALAAAAVLIPCYLIVRTRNDANTNGELYQGAMFGNIGSFLQSFFWGHSLDTNGDNLFTYNTYCGVAVVLLMVCYLLNSKISWKHRLKRFLIIGFLSLSLCMAVLVYLMHGFSYPHSFSNRNGFLLTVFIFVSAFEQICKLQKLGIVRLILVCVGITGLVVCAFVLNNDVQTIVCYLGTILLLAYFIICLVLYERNSIKKKSLIVNIVIFGLIEVISNSIVINDKDEVDIRLLPDIAASEWEQQYDAIQTKDGERKTSLIFSDNSFIYSDTNLFSSMKNTDMVWLFENLGLTYQENGGSYVYRGTTPVTAAMFNVRNVLTDSPAHYGGYTEKNSRIIENNYRDTSDKIYLLENENLSGFGFMAQETLADWNWIAENAFEVQNDFVNKVTGEEANVFSTVDISDIEILGNYCLPYKQNGNQFAYMSTAFNDSIMCIALEFEIPENMHLYAHLKDTYKVMTNVYIDGKEYSALDAYPSNGETIDFGMLKQGQRVILVIYTLAPPGVNGAVTVDFYALDDARMQTIVKKMQREKLEITSFSDTAIEGHITAEQDGIMYTSIPYYKGFHVYVDGEQTPVSLVGNALIGVPLSAGEHDIRITYFPYGLKLGIVLSILGLMGMTAIFLYERRKRK